MGLGLSTSWNAFRYEDAQGLVFEIKDLGFEAVELSFNLTGRIVEGIAGLVDRGAIKVTSVHNFCPIPDGLARPQALPDCYSVAAPEDEERSTAIKFAKRSIDTCARLNARAVVLHCGRVQVPCRTKDLIGLYSYGQKDSPQFIRLRDEIIRERKAKIRPYFDSLLKSLDELNAYASKQGVILGIETRIYYREIPSFEEIGRILTEFKDSNICYWHDTGHAQVMQELGFVRHQDYLDAYAGRLAGIHIHDVSGCRDHQAPGTGNLDFSFLTPYLKKDSIKILEIHHPATVVQVKEGKSRIESVFQPVL